MRLQLVRAVNPNAFRDWESRRFQERNFESDQSQFAQATALVRISCLFFPPRGSIQGNGGFRRSRPR